MRKGRITQAQKIAELNEHLNFVEQQLRLHIKTCERLFRFIYEKMDINENDTQDTANKDTHDNKQERSN
tara:strand:+ start:858 stop:1064 length:207 start_codon:yes stop_codon:yes gene_type:complete